MSNNLVENATGLPGSAQAAILAFVPRVTRTKPDHVTGAAPVVSMREWATANRKTVPRASDETVLAVMRKIREGYTENLGSWWSVTYDGRWICQSYGEDGWSSNDRYDAYSVVCAVTRLMGLGEYICEDFIRDVYDWLDHNLPSPVAWSPQSVH